MRQNYILSCFGFISLLSAAFLIIIVWSMEIEKAAFDIPANWMMVILILGKVDWVCLSLHVGVSDCWYSMIWKVTLMAAQEPIIKLDLICLPTFGHKLSFGCTRGVFTQWQKVHAHMEIAQKCIESLEFPNKPFHTAFLLPYNFTGWKNLCSRKVRLELLKKNSFKSRFLDLRLPLSFCAHEGRSLLWSTELVLKVKRQTNRVVHCADRKKTAVLMV